MTPIRLHELLRSGKHYKRLKGQAIQASGDGGTFYLVNKGYIKRYLILKDGALGVQSIYGPGYFFPLTPAFLHLLGQTIYSGDEMYFYEAVTDAEIYSIDKDTLQRAAEADPLLYKDILFEAGKRLQSNIQQLENISLKSAYWRLAHQLVFLAEQFGQPTDEGIEIQVPVTHQDLADILSLSRETVSREMVKLKTKGLIEANRHTVVRDINALRRIYS